MHADHFLKAFLTKKMIKQIVKSVVLKLSKGKGALPEGFFDNKDADLRARGIEPVKVDPKDEYKEFEKLIQEDLHEVDERYEEEEIDAADVREEEDTLEQKCPRLIATKIGGKCSYSSSILLHKDSFEMEQWFPLYQDGKLGRLNLDWDELDDAWHIAAECNAKTMCWNCKESGHVANQCKNEPICHVCGKVLLSCLMTTI